MRLSVDRTGRGVVVKLAFFVTLYALILVLMIVRWTPQRGTAATVKFIGAAVILAGLVQQAVMSRRLRKSWPLVHPWPIRLGDDVKAELRAVVKHNASAIAANVRCVEEVKICAKTKFEETKIAELYSLDLAASDLCSERRALTAAWTFAVPQNMPPSLDVPSNKVQWLLATTITTTAGEVPVAFELLVIPEVAR
jgi:hypothetical protein